MTFLARVIPKTNFFVLIDNVETITIAVGFSAPPTPFKLSPNLV